MIKEQHNEQKTTLAQMTMKKYNNKRNKNNDYK